MYMRARRRAVFVSTLATCLLLTLVQPASAASVEISGSPDFSACASADFSPNSFPLIVGFFTADGVANGLPYQAGTSTTSASGGGLTLCLPTAPGGPIDAGNVTFTFSAVGLRCFNCIPIGGAVATMNCTIVAALFHCQPLVRQAVPINVSVE